MTSRKAVDWHYARSDLAAQYVRMFDEVGAHSLLLCSPNGSGKTEFLARDLMPAAGAAGLFPIYLNVADEVSSPAASLRYGLLRAADEAGLLQKVREALSRGKADVSVGLNLGVARVDVKGALAEKRRVASDDSLHFSLRQVIDSIRKHGGKKLLLIIDEADLLAGKPENENFLKSLRTLLDERRGKICTLFVGSSKPMVDSLFTYPRSPLFKFATPQEFAPLGERFLAHWRANILKVMDAREDQITQAQMREAFKLTRDNPRVFWSSVIDMIQHGSLDIVAHARKAADPVGESSALAERLAGLSTLDRMVLRSIVERAVQVRDGLTPARLDLFAPAARAGFKEHIGMTPTPSQIQGSLLRLAETDTPLIVATGKGVYDVEDPYCLAWLQEELLEGPHGAGSPAPAQAPLLIVGSEDQSDGSEPDEMETALERMTG